MEKVSNPIQIRLLVEPFSDENEEQAGKQLSYAQRKYLQQLLAEVGSERISLPVDSEKQIDYLFKAEFLRGQIVILNYLLHVSEVADATQDF